MTFADLHMHSRCSDGMLTPEQIVEEASCDRNIAAIAITDHDTLEGARRGVDYAQANDCITCIPGVEITTKFNERAVHMLGYFIDTEDAGLAALFERTRGLRKERALKIAKLLEDDGYPLNTQELLDSGGTINRPLIARMLVEHGYAKDVDDCFATMIGSGCPYYVDADYPDTIEAMRLIAAAGGFSFVAHPAHYHVVDLISTFAKEGMDGLEAYHTLQTPLQSAELAELAKEYNLFVSGGSDWHGDDVHGAYLGSAGLDEDGYASFLQVCENKLGD